MNRILPAILCGAIALLLVSCTKEKNIAVTSVSVSQATAEMLIGESIQVYATVLPSDATDKTVFWASSKQTVATVSSSGMVTAIAEGVSTITASAGGFIATCVVTVSKRVIPVSSVELNKTSLTLVKGATEALSAIVKPNDATDSSVIWSSSDTSVASVENDGRVTAVGGGEAIICAKAGDQEAKCIITVTVPVTSVSLNKETITLIEGESEVLVAKIEPEDATDKTITWSSSNAQIAAVGDDGEVIAIKEGEATITAKAGDKSATCKVKVNAPFIPVSAISLNKNTLELKKGDSETLVASVSPDNATEPAVTWSSSNTAIASVDNDGRVTAVGGGEATICAKAGGKEAKCIVTVTVPVASVSLNKETITLIEGESEVLVAKIEPEDATDKTIAWSSSNAQIATVGDDGKVTAIKEGEATITAKAGAKSATCKVKVSAPYIPVSGISLNKSTLELKKGNSETLVASVSPNNATEPAVTWSSSNESIAKVNQEGKVTAVNSGAATITAKAGNHSATCDVTVVIPVTGVTLDNLSLTLSKGSSTTLTAKVYPEDATNKTVTWSSDNKGVATVTDGAIVAVGGGVTEIRARTQDGGFVATCTVTVQVPVQSVSLNKTSLDIYQYDEVKLTATVYPSDATKKALTWSSDKKSVATVDSNGKVTGVSGGSATITVKTTDGGYTAQCYVTVTADGHQAVDLGLSVKWATMNYAANSTTATGGYYLWGDPTGTAVITNYTAPNTNSISGTQYDIVRKNWGGNWRIPTRTEVGELFTSCTWKKETVNGISVFRVTGPNGNSIIIPPTGLAYPADGPIGTTSIVSGERAYLMSGTSYSESYGRFVYTYYRSPDGSYNWETYNVDFIKIAIRPVR